MDLVAVGLSLRSASLPALETLSEGAALARAEERARALAGVRESVRLVTCQRAVLLLGISHPLRNASSAPQAGSVTAASHRRGGPAAMLSLAREARRILAEEAGIAEGGEADAVVALSGVDAFRHLLRLACGLESPVEGETEILGQLRAAYAAAVERGAAGRITGGAMHRVFRAARRIRAHAGFPSASPSWGEFLAETISTLSRLERGTSVRVIGSGTLGQSLTTSLRARGMNVIPGHGATAPAPSTSGARHRDEARVLVTVSGRGRILGASDPALARRDGSSEALEIWDLGMPRNVDPAVASVRGVRLRTLADIPAFARTPDARRESRRAAEAMVEEETGRWSLWLQERSAARTLVRLGRMLEASSHRFEDTTDHDAPGAAPRRGFRSALLGAFTTMAQEARDEDEASAHLALFEEALRRATSAANEPSARVDGSLSRGPHTQPPARRVPVGTVSLVGAGPGTGGLLTLEGARRLAEADVVYHDALAREEVLAHCRPGARLVPVGKRRGRAIASQAEIEEALVRDAKAGLAVVRLKGGDPFVFGRGGEEGLALRRGGVPFEVVPGVSSGIAAPALAGIPLTHRGLASSAAFVTAHDLSDGAEGEERRARLAHLARGADTLVVFMAGAELARVRRTLLDAGLPADTPAALIESGATRDQRVAVGTLDGLECLADGLRGGPTLVVIGRTVQLAGVLGSGDLWTAGAVEMGEGAAPAPQETNFGEMRPRRSRHDRRRAG